MHIQILSRIHRLACTAGALLILVLATVVSTEAEVSTRKLPVLTGTDVLSVHSKSVGDDFVVYVRVPPEAAAEPERKFPVIYTLDGDHTFPMMASVVTELGFSGAVPPAIIVGIGYGTLDLENGNHRSRDLSPQAFKQFPGLSGGGPKFLKFLTEEAFPMIESKYPADGGQRYLFGHSLGGLFALYTYTKQAEDFAGIVAGSPALVAQLPFLEQTAGDGEARSCRLCILTGDEEDAATFRDDLGPLEARLE
ncbi:MAG: hypothetical protein KJT03_10760, partial [Verrucomicrobiae bacterium]|nr:hypothetical protein [Verrucomicrobiae bacterium]